MSTIVDREQLKGALGAVSSERVANPEAPLGKHAIDATLRFDVSPAEAKCLLNTFTSSPSAS